MDQFFSEIDKLDFLSANELSDGSEHDKSSEPQKDDLELLRQEIDSIEQHCQNLITQTKARQENENRVDSQLLNLKEPSNMEEILAIDEALIAPNPYNVSIINSACQKVLKDMKQTLLYLLKKNRREQEYLQNYLMTKNKTRGSEINKKINIKCIGIPYFKDSNGYPPPANSDVLKKKAASKILPVDIINSFSTWRSKHSSILVKAVNDNVSADLSNPEAIDWMKISATDMDGKFSPTECKSKWRLNLCPSLNKSRWRAEETNSLKVIAERFNKQNWDEIAKELGTNRSGFQCCVQYQTHVPQNVNRWTKEEDKELLRVIDTFKVKDHIPWKKVVWNFEGRSLRQCQERYFYHLVNIKKGSFSMQEDYVLVYLFSKLKNFRKVAQLFPNRVPPQIRSRYEYLVKISMPKFSKEEDELLLNLMTKYPKNWSKISEHLENRSRLQCRRRWFEIKKEIGYSKDYNCDVNMLECTDFDSEINSTSLLQNSDTKDTAHIKKNLHTICRYDKKGSSSMKYSEQYDKLLDYFKFSYKFLFGPKARIPSNISETDQMAFELKVTMKNLFITSTSCLRSYDSNLLEKDCNFDIDDFLLIKHIKASEDDDKAIVHQKNKILPPNFTTLVGLRTIMLSLNNNRSLHWDTLHKDLTETQSSSSSDRLLFSDAKKLFKSRIRALFAFPLLLYNSSQDTIEGKNYKKPKVKKATKPLSKLKRRNHAKYMNQAYRKKLENEMNEKILDLEVIKDESVTANSTNSCSQDQNIKNQNAFCEKVTKKRGRPRKGSFSSSEITEGKKAKLE